MAVGPDRLISLTSRPFSRRRAQKHKLRDLDSRTLLNYSASRKLAPGGSSAGDPALPSPTMTEYRIEHDSMGEVGCPPTPDGRPRPSGRSRTSRSRACRIERALIGALAADQGRGGAGQRPARRSIDQATWRRPSRTRPPRSPTARWDDQFPIDVFQTGSGTSSNMNANEVHRHAGLRAARRAGAPERPRQRVAVVERRVPVGHPPRRGRRPSPSTCCPRSSTWRARCGKKPRQFKPVVKSGRTHLMDATPVTLGQEFGGYAAAGRARRRAHRATRCPASASCRSAAPRWAPGINAPKTFARSVIKRAGRTHRTCRSPRRPTTSPRRAPATRWSRRRAQLRTLAVSLVKIANDMRWMGSGPAHRPGRDPHARPAAGLVDHAGQGQPGDPRGGDPGGGAGDRQRRRGRASAARQGNFELNVVPAGDRPQPARVDPRCCANVSPAVRRPVRRRHRGRRRAAAGAYAESSPVDRHRRSTPTSATRRRPRSSRPVDGKTGRSIRELVLERGPDDRRASSTGPSTSSP